MTDSPAKYRAIQSSEDQAYHSDSHEARFCRDELYSTTECIPAEARTNWTYFLLGCAILLPWSGNTSRRTLIFFVLMSTQLCLMGRRFSCPDWLVPPFTRLSARTGLASTH
jgi:hypothetical protein